MQLDYTFSTLLASLLVLVSVSVNHVDARPATRNSGMVTMPLKRIASNTTGIHPQILLQQHIHRGHSRLARMKGRTPPTEHEMRSNIQKRMLLLGHKAHDSDHTKRYNRWGVKGSSSSSLNSDGNSFIGDADANSTGADGSQINPAEVTAAAQNAITPADNPPISNSLGLDIQANDVGYFGIVQIGTPPRDFKILMDSGSSDFWVGSEQCQSQAGGDCGNHQLLGSQSSSSFVSTGKAFADSYGTGNVKGVIVQDNVALAGLPLSQHTFGVATSESVDFSADSTPFDGLMGLAKSDSLSEQNTLTPIESLAAQNLVNAPITSFKLGRVASGNNDGEVTFGGLDSSKFDANTLVQFQNVNPDGFWEGNIDSVTVNGQDLGLQGRTGILDTGTTLIIAPPDDATAVHAAIPGAKSDGNGGFTIPCTSTAQVALSFGGQTFPIDTRDLVALPVDPNDLTGDCTSGISSGTVGGPTEWLVGAVFLKNAYFSVDVGNNVIALAHLNE